MNLSGHRCADSRAAIVLIVVLLGVAMRSWRRILLALPANVIPVALTLGLMGLTGIPLDVASATIATVILGPGRGRHHAYSAAVRERWHQRLVENRG